jgi:RimJ/RimL family protein N-acetyltransferase
MPTTAHLILVDATLELLDAAIDNPTRLGALLDAAVADDWAGFPEALPRLRELQAQNPTVGWGTILFVLDEPRTLVGMGGYKGPPSREGTVEIGYAIAPHFRRSGLATAAARALVERAFNDARVHAVTAETLAESNGSTKVLERAQFVRVGERMDDAHGLIWQWQLQRANRSL